MSNITVITPLRLGYSLPSRGWDNHGFLNDNGGSFRAYGTRLMTMDWGRAHVLAFTHVLIIFAPTIFYILWYNFPLNVANYAFSFSFSYFNLQCIIPGLTQGGVKGIGRLSLCGPMGAMWT